MSFWTVRILLPFLKASFNSLETETSFPSHPAKHFSLNTHKTLPLFPLSLCKILFTKPLFTLAFTFFAKPKLVLHPRLHTSSLLPLWNLNLTSTVCDSFLLFAIAASSQGFQISVCHRLFRFKIYCWIVF